MAISRVQGKYQNGETAICCAFTTAGTRLTHFYKGTIFTSANFTHTTFQTYFSFDIETVFPDYEKMISSFRNWLRAVDDRIFLVKPAESSVADSEAHKFAVGSLKLHFIVFHANTHKKCTHKLIFTFLFITIINTIPTQN